MPDRQERSHFPRTPEDLSLDLPEARPNDYLELDAEEHFDRLGGRHWCLSRRSLDDELPLLPLSPEVGHMTRPGDETCIPERLIAALCDRLETAWCAGHRLSISALLLEVHESLRDFVFPRLLEVELALESRETGGCPELEVLLKRYPEWEEPVRSAWIAFQRGNFDTPSESLAVTLTSDDATNTEHSFQWVSTSNCFAGLPARELFELAHVMERASFDANELILQRGQIGDFLYVLVSGVVEVSIDVGDGRHVLAECGPGDFLGEMSIVTGKPCSADVVCRSPVECFQISRAAVESLRAKSPLLRRCLSNTVGDRLGGGVLDALSGQTLNGYQIERPLGKGGMAIVYSAKQESSGTTYALKMMSHYLSESSNARGRFRREADIMRRLDHPHLIRAHDLFVELNSLFIVMDLCSGGTLADQIEQNGRKGLPANEVRQILGQLARGLLYLHSQGIVHRDIKPSNVMLEPDGQVKLADFGLAEMLRLDDTRAGTSVCGTPMYMAPEQMQGDPVGEPADWYAFGLVAFQLLTGQLPFKATTFGSLLDAKISVEDSQATVDRRIKDEDLRQLITSSLRPDPEHRVLDLEIIAGWSVDSGRSDTVHPQGSSS